MASLKSPPTEPRLPTLTFALLALALMVLVVAGFLREERREWRSYQESFRDLEIARGTTVEERRQARERPIELAQIVVPELDTVDRCISCHLGVDDATYAGAGQPFAYHPDHDVHPFERFGCTVCHAGQGRATSAREAHGDVPFWDRPMLPLDFVEASCGGCHDPSDNPAAPRLARGAELFEEAGCRGCHRLDGWGGGLAPDLDRQINGRPRSPEWLMQHFLDPAQVVPDSAMPRYGFSPDDAKALTLLMLSRRRPEVSGYHASRRILESAETGRRLFRAKGCIGCHQISGAGGEVGPPLDHVVTRRTEGWLVAHFREPRAVTPGTVMPDFDFTEAEAHSLILFLRRIHERTITVLDEPSPERRGEILFKRYGCRGCHGVDATGGVPNRNSESGEQVPSLIYVKEGYTRAELKDRIRIGVPKVGKLEPDGPEPPLAMPGFGDRLTEGQLDDLVSYLHSLYPAEDELDW